MELRNMETTLSNEREQHVNEIKKLNALLNEKVLNHFLLLIASRFLIFLYSFFEGGIFKLLAVYFVVTMITCHYVDNLAGYYYSGDEERASGKTHSKTG